MVGENEGKKNWVCPKGHTFTLRSDYFTYLGEYQAYLDPKIRAEDSPCGGCSEYMQDACIFEVVAHFEGGSSE